MHNHICERNNGFVTKFLLTIDGEHVYVQFKHPFFTRCNTKPIAHMSVSFLPFFRWMANTDKTEEHKTVRWRMRTRSHLKNEIKIRKSILLETNFHTILIISLALNGEEEAWLFEFIHTYVKWLIAWRLIYFFKKIYYDV